MKIQVVGTGNKPLSHTKIPLQIRGKNSGYLSCTTDENGFFELDKKYQGQEISSLLGNLESKWLEATDGATITVDTSTPKIAEKEKHTTQSYK